MQLYSPNSGERVSAKAGALIDRKAPQNAVLPIRTGTRFDGKEITAAVLEKALRH